MTEKEKILFDVLYSRRSVRSFVEGKKVEAEKIEKLLKAAMAAPSACNTQPWEFVVVTEDDILARLKDAIDYGKYNAPLIIAVCGNPAFIPWEAAAGITDCCAAIENMLLAATAMDLGSVWVGGFEADAVRRVLDIPQEVVPIGMIYFGYPAGDLPEPRTQYTEKAIHFQKYDRTRTPGKREGSLA